MKTRRDALISLMTERGLTINEVAELLGRSYATVKCWRCQKTGRDIPANMLELLRAKK